LFGRHGNGGSAAFAVGDDKPGVDLVIRQLVTEAKLEFSAHVPRHTFVAGGVSRGRWSSLSATATLWRFTALTASPATSTDPAAGRPTAHRQGLAVQFVKEQLTFTPEHSPMANLSLNPG
jgi:hypothetical protein